MTENREKEHDKGNTHYELIGSARIHPYFAWILLISMQDSKVK